jgi:hypothetical protein
MSFKLSALLITIVLVFQIAGCGSDDVVMPESPAMVSGETDAEGVVVLETGPYTVTYKTINIDGNPVSGVNVTGFLLHEHLACVASHEPGSYYPAIKIVSLSEVQNSGIGRINIYDNNYGINSNARVLGTDFTIELLMNSITMAVNGYDVEPPNMEFLISDDWTVLNSTETDMAGLFALASSSAYHNSIYIYLTPEVEFATGAGRQTAAFVMSEIQNLETFNVLASIGLGLYGGDSVTVSTIAYQDTVVPVLYIYNFVKRLL